MRGVYIVFWPAKTLFWNFNRPLKTYKLIQTESSITHDIFRGLYKQDGGQIYASCVLYNGVF